MQRYNISVEITKSPSRPNEAPTYGVAILSLIPEQGAISGAVSGAAAGMKDYQTDKEPFIVDLRQKLRYTDDAIKRLFASPGGIQTLTDFSLSDEDAAYFGW